MKKVLLVAVAILMLGSVSFGQDVVPGLAAGSKALLFSFSGFSFVGAGTFDGGFGAKYYLSESMAIRGGIQFTSASVTNSANPPTGQSGIDGSQSATAIGVSGAVELHLGKGRVSPYLGGGVMFTTTSTEFKPIVTGVPPLTQTTTKNSNGGETINGTNYQGGTTFMVYGLAGFEFFLYKELSLAGEYRVGFASTSRKDQEFNNGTTTTTTKLGSSSVIGITSQGTLTLGVYF